MHKPLRIGIDIGGTFTDFTVFSPESGEIQTFKLPSTPHDPAEAVLRGLEKLRPLEPLGEGEQQPELRARLSVVHGSTVATNTLLERNGAPTALITTQGFRDILRIGRQDRPALYDLFADTPTPLVPEAWCLEVNERVDHRGRVLQALDSQEIEEQILFLKREGITSIAVCLLFSFAHPAHEEMIARELRAAGFSVSPSIEILPEFREYERASTTVINAYVSPIMASYLATLESALEGDDLQVMQSNGGCISADQARRQAVRCILSGPAGGVIGARSLSRITFHSEGGADGVADQDKVITFDMGGTSTDVSLLEGDLKVNKEASIGGFPLRVPILDIHSVGSGGGSIARVDAGGALRVGPDSAGADPGPACYGRGKLPTVTDANLVLGRLVAENFLGGEIQLDEGRAWSALTRLGLEAGLGPQEAALGVVEVVNARMERALRVISVERGHDPREFTLVSYGGAGGLHAADLARSLAIPRVLVPRHAATFSALGMLLADVVKDYTKTLMLPAEKSSDEVAAHLGALSERAQADLLAEGIPHREMQLERSLDLRYQGQSYELTVPYSAESITEFHRVHQMEYGYAETRTPVTIVNVRVRATGKVPKPDLVAQMGLESSPVPALVDRRPVIIPRGEIVMPFYRGEALQPGIEILGPAVIMRADTTIFIGPEDRCLVDAYQNFVIEIHTE